MEKNSLMGPSWGSHPEFSHFGSDLDLYLETLHTTSNKGCEMTDRVREGPTGHYLTDNSNINIVNAQNSRVIIAAVHAIGMKVLKK